MSDAEDLATASARKGLSSELDGPFRFGLVCWASPGTSAQGMTRLLLQGRSLGIVSSVRLPARRRRIGRFRARAEGLAGHSRRTQLPGLATADRTRMLRLRIAFAACVASATSGVLLRPAAGTESVAIDGAPALATE